ncbi:hypothetical protein MJT46_016132 [Ovis ammon polii x Ovis aries]|nr:hypothetical protein MJT46_016132 [Ovis ammon polii x Ovis aries]
MVQSGSEASQRWIEPPPHRNTHPSRKKHRCSQEDDSQQARNALDKVQDCSLEKDLFLSQGKGGLCLVVCRIIWFQVKRIIFPETLSLGKNLLGENSKSHDNHRSYYWMRSKRRRGQMSGLEGSCSRRKGKRYRITKVLWNLKIRPGKQTFCMTNAVTLSIKEKCPLSLIPKKGGHVIRLAPLDPLAPRTPPGRNQCSVKPVGRMFTCYLNRMHVYVSIRRPALTSLDPSPTQGYYSVIRPHDWSCYCGCTGPHNGKEVSDGNGL